MVQQTAALVSEESRLIERFSPVDGRLVSSERSHDLEECAALAARAAAAFPHWAATSAADRGAILSNVADVIASMEDAFCTAMMEEIAAPRAWAQRNVAFASEMLRDIGAYAPEVGRIETLPPRDGIAGQAERVPCGVCLGIAPFNAPLILGVRALAAPLLCGNTVLLKGNDIAPRTFRLFGQALRDGGVPEGVAAVILTHPDQSEAAVETLIGSPVVRRVNFTGSTRVGRRIAGLCAQHLKRPLLELGGQANVLVMADADLDAAAEAIVRGAYLNQGQICLSTERLIVEDTIADALLDRIETRRSALRLGDPKDAQTDLGPVINIAAAERLNGLIKDAIAKGGTLVGGGSVQGTFVQPTLIDGVEADMRLYREEVFGPILSVTRVADKAEAITVSNDSEYGLATSVFSKDAAQAEDIAHQLQSGICHINGCTVDDDPHAPFGGVKSSGYGRFGGRWAIDEFTELRWITRAADTSHGR